MDDILLAQQRVVQPAVKQNDAMPATSLQLLEYKAGLSKIHNRVTIHEKLRGLVKAALPTFSVSADVTANCPREPWKTGPDDFLKAFALFHSNYPCVQFPADIFCNWANEPNCSTSTVLQAQDMIVAMLSGVFTANEQFKSRSKYVKVFDYNTIFESLALLGHHAGILGVAAARLKENPAFEVCEREVREVKPRAKKTAAANAEAGVKAKRLRIKKAEG
jgi:hypothetical protein